MRLFGWLKFPPVLYKTIFSSRTEKKMVKAIVSEERGLEIRQYEMTSTVMFVVQPVSPWNWPSAIDPVGATFLSVLAEDAWSIAQTKRHEHNLTGTAAVFGAKPGSQVSRRGSSHGNIKYHHTIVRCVWSLNSKIQSFGITVLGGKNTKPHRLPWI